MNIQVKKKRIWKDTRFLLIYLNWNQDMTHVENKLQGCFQWSNILISVPMPLGSTRTEIVKTEVTKSGVNEGKILHFCFTRSSSSPFSLEGEQALWRGSPAGLLPTLTGEESQGLVVSLTGGGLMKDPADLLPIQYDMLDMHFKALIQSLPGSRKAAHDAWLLTEGKGWTGP